MSRFRCLRPINPLLMMNRAGHRIFQQVAPGVCMHAAGGGDDRCFFIVSAEIGVPFADQIAVCFNEVPDAATCHSAPPFNFKTDNRGDYDTQGSSGYDYGATCLAFSVGYTAEPQDSAGPLDVVKLDYAPGACHKSGDADPECVLDAYSNFVVTNSIWGPTSVRVGDLADDIVIAVFPTEPAVIGAQFIVRVNDNPVGYTPSIVNNQIRFQLAAPVSSSDVLTLTHDSTIGAQAADGRYCWKFDKMPVLNVIGVSFWNREDAGPWLIDPRGSGRWRLEN